MFVLGKVFIAANTRKWETPRKTAKPTPQQGRAKKQDNCDMVPGGNSFSNMRFINRLGTNPFLLSTRILSQRYRE